MLQSFNILDEIPSYPEDFFDNKEQIMMNVQGDQAPAKRHKMLKKFENSSMKTIAEQSVSSQTSLVSVTEFAKRS